MREKPLLRLIGVVAVIRLVLLFWRIGSSESERPAPVVPAPPPPFTIPVVPDSEAAVPDCPPELSKAFGSNSLTLEPLGETMRAELRVMPDEAAAMLADKYDGPLHVWCLGQVSTFADAVDPIEPTAIYVLTAVPTPNQVILMSADESPSLLILGVGGNAVTAWLDRQAR